MQPASIARRDHGTARPRSLLLSSVFHVTQFGEDVELPMRLGRSGVAALTARSLSEGDFQMLPVLRDHLAIGLKTFAPDRQNEFRGNAGRIGDGNAGAVEAE